jgi:hypothetical protein
MTGIGNEVDCSLFEALDGVLRCVNVRVYDMIGNISGIRFAPCRPDFVPRRGRLFVMIDVPESSCEREDIGGINALCGFTP